MVLKIKKIKETMMKIDGKHVFSELGTQLQ